ncbi:MAG: hypothetical protein GEV03_13560 [Streptosporangiales bacterium]|nr:hypothetical protein [Streptosporangiales bacterium]
MDSSWFTVALPVVLSGVIGSGSAFFVARMTHRHERDRSREEAKLRRDVAWAELQKTTALQAQEALRIFWQSVRKVDVSLDAGTDTAAEWSQCADAGSQVVMYASRMDNRALGKEIGTWAVQVQSKVEAAIKESTLDHEWMKSFVAQQRDLRDRLGEEARTIHHARDRREIQQLIALRDKYRRDGSDISQVVADDLSRVLGDDDEIERAREERQNPSP